MGNLQDEPLGDLCREKFASLEFGGNTEQEHSAAPRVPRGAAEHGCRPAHLQADDVRGGPASIFGI